MPQSASGSINNKPSPINAIRRDGHAWGKKESQIAIHALGDNMTRDEAIGWINSAIDKRKDYLRASGLSPTEVKEWDKACRIMFVLNIHYINSSL